ncbi:unnamed protein product [Pipistrellus nathusii]|uniref:Colony stimulating factor 1 n=1 Tax=Pipistrellus nathusii TaxID=59473 RepID=A0ABN9ZLN1_PIPNA
MTARGAAGRCPPTTWLGPRLLLVCLLVNRSITEEESKHCSHMIGDGHLQLLQQMIDSQMETGCKIPFQFVNEDQLEDRVCYIKKAFSLAQDIMQETISFKDNTANAIALVKLLELSVRLKDCFPQVSEEHDTACVRNFSESPLWALEKIKNVFNETKNLLKTNQSIFSKNCSDSFAKCTVPGHSKGPGTHVVTTPDCNCLYPKATPSSDPASASPQQPLAPATAPLAALPWAGSEGTEDSSLLPSEQPARTEDPGSAKQRPPRSTCQTFESPGTPGAEGGPVGGSPEPPGAAVSGTEDILNSVLGANWALEEASGEASEGPAPRGPEPAPSGRGGGSVQAEAVRHSNLISASLLRGPAKSQLPAGVTDEPSSTPRAGEPVLRPLLLSGGGVVVVLVLVLLAVGGLLLHRRRRRSHRELWIMDSSWEQPEGSPLAQPEDRRVETPV